MLGLRHKALNNEKTNKIKPIKIYPIVDDNVEYLEETFIDFMAVHIYFKSAET